MLHRSAHFLSPHRHLFWHAPWSKYNYLPLSDNHIPAKVDHLSYDATIWVLHWSFTINPPSTHASSSHTFTALQLSYTRTSLHSIQHQLLATSCQSGTDLQLWPAHQSWQTLTIASHGGLKGTIGWQLWLENHRKIWYHFVLLRLSGQWWQLLEFKLLPPCSICHYCSCYPSRKSQLLLGYLSPCTFLLAVWQQLPFKHIHIHHTTTNSSTPTQRQSADSPTMLTF